jgi:hypothetical protein
MRRRLAAAAIALLAASTLTACSPPPKPIIALGIRDGKPIAVLVICDKSYSRISVFENEDRPQPTATPAIRQHIRWAIGGEPTTDIVEAELLGTAPAGWTVSEPSVGIATPTPGAFETVELTQLQPGTRYGLGGSSDHQAYTITFTTADFDRIKPGHVLGWRDGDQEQMPRAEFEDNARDSCAN